MSNLFEVGEIDRKTYIGGSDAAAVMGLGAYGKTPYTVWLAKTGQLVDQLDPERERFFMRRKRFEPIIVEMLREEFGAEIVSMNKRYKNTSLPDFLAAEIDFEWKDPETGLIENGEIKTVSPFAFGPGQGWGEDGTDEVPIQYAAQVVHGLGVTGRRKAIVAALVGFDRMLFYKVDRDEDVVQDMQGRCIKFWNENVIARVEPEPLVLEDLNTMLLKRNGKPVTLNDEMADMLKELKLARGRLKDLDEAIIPELQFKIQNYIRTQWGVSPEGDPPNDNAELIHNGVVVAKWNRQRGASLDQKKLKADNPDLVQAYTREQFFRSLRFVKPK